MGLLPRKNLGVCLNYCALKGCNSLNDILTKYCLNSSLSSRNTHVCISACVIWQINRQEDEYSFYLHAHVFNNILQRTHVLQKLFFWKNAFTPFCPSLFYTSYIHIAGKISVHLNYFSLMALNQWVVLKQRIELLKTARQSVWERLLNIDDF